MSFGRSSSKAGGDKQRTRRATRRHEEAGTMTQIKRKRKHKGRGEQILTPTEVSYSKNSSLRIRLQRRAKPFVVSSAPQDEHRQRERGSIQTEGSQSQKSLTVKSRKCKLLFTFRNVAAEVASFAKLLYHY